MVLQAMANSVAHESDLVTELQEEIVEMAIRFMRHMLKGKLVLLGGDPSSADTPHGSITQPSRTIESQLAIDNPDDFYNTYKPYIVKTIRRAESTTLASSIGGSHLMPPIVDSNNDKYNVRLATSWCTALENLGLGMTPKGSTRFCRVEYTSLRADNKLRLLNIGLGEDYCITKQQKIC